MKKKTIFFLALGFVVLVVAVVLIYFFVIKNPVIGNAPQNTSALFEQVRSTVNQDLAS